VISDDLLVASVHRGDERALAELITRYDRLVRYTIFRASRSECAKDPAWLDGLASSTWSGFVEIARRTEERPRHVRSLLVTIARNQAVSALRSVGRRGAGAGASLAEAAPEIPALLEEPSELLDRVEELEAFRDCLAAMHEDDRMLATQLGLIMDRRWRDAAAALDRSESTLRSQWKRFLERLGESFRRKTGRTFAPTGDEHDS
jgi:RNA polymerase sigma factor (sigma-70 family)